MILNYNIKEEKREIQRRFFPLIKKKKLVTLAGPSIIDYMNMLPKIIKEVQIWENNSMIMIEQLKHIKSIDKLKIDYRFGDILKAEIRKDTFYDLDFCCSTAGASRQIRKFKDCDYSLTLALRPIGLKRVIENFLSIIEEELISDIPHPYFNLLKTNKNDYIYIAYHDLNPMVNIFKFH